MVALKPCRFHSALTVLKLSLNHGRVETPSGSSVNPVYQRYRLTMVALKLFEKRYKSDRHSVLSLNHGRVETDAVPRYRNHAKEKT